MEWAELWTAMEKEPAKWHPTTRNMYWNQLEVLWPRRWIGNAFMVGEPYTHNDEGQAVHATFKQTGRRFYARYMTVPEFEQTFTGKELA